MSQWLNDFFGVLIYSYFHDIFQKSLFLKRNFKQNGGNTLPDTVNVQY